MEEKKKITDYATLKRLINEEIANGKNPYGKDKLLHGGHRIKTHA